ncbi:hypothetical protein [Rathayibacter iranicus]|uniref:hypothetical protein n=1 Tax=Rathayibacter iranicus TaxID=59737 RepID=UPI0013E3A491|nr:hypothetical protein [Rathayibacter iranicus]
MSILTSRVAETSGGWDRGGDLNVPEVAVVSEIDADVSTLIDAQDAQGGEVSE